MTDHQRHEDALTEIEDHFSAYTVHDRDHENIGNVDDLFLDEGDRPEYIGIKMGFLGTRSTLIPFSLVRVDDKRRVIEVAAEREYIKGGPTFGEDEDIDPEFEREVHSYYGLGGAKAVMDSGGDGVRDADKHTGAITTGPETAGTVGSGMSMGDTETGEFREHDRNVEGVSQPGSDLEDEDELRVQRSEEELRAGTREREAGSMRVRKRVRTDRERIEVPRKREEVTVERVPLGGEATEAQIGEDEVVVPITEEEIVVEKRPVAREEVRIRKDVVDDTEVVEADVRREEVEIEDATERRRDV